ncbi:MAG: alpha/beta hydrolase, partial [Bacteroidetes bacterium]|nr:alpha/beta hydrolase [Bacteroidota bacterium]
KYFKDNKDSVFAYQKVPVEHQQDYVNGMIKQFMDPWSRCFLSLDPVKYLTKVHCPVLALNGTKDRQVKADINLAEINKALKKAGNKNFQTMSVEGLNHMFQECKTGMTTEYASIEQTFSPKALELIGKFISDVTK